MRIRTVFNRTTPKYPNPTSPIHWELIGPGRLIGHDELEKSLQEENPDGNLVQSTGVYIYIYI